MEKITLIGRLGRDASIKESQQGTRFLTFTMACDAYVRGESRTHWYDVTSFDPNRYKNMLKYLTKGSSVTVVGDLDADIEEGRDGVTRIRRRVSADSIQFTPGNTSGSTSESRTASKRDSDEPDDIDEEEITTTKRPRKRNDEDEDRRPVRAVREDPEDYDDDEDMPKVKARKATKPAVDEEGEPEKPKRKREPEPDEEEEAPKARTRKAVKEADDDEDDLPF